MNYHSAYEYGYDSEGQSSTCVIPDLVKPNGLVLFENPLLVVFLPFPPLDPIFENFAQKFMGATRMPK